MREIYEEERIEAIKRHVEGKKSVEIYRSLGKSKPWFMKWCMIGEIFFNSIYFSKVYDVMNLN